MDVDVIPVVASQFVCESYPVNNKTLALCVSQSGETADTIVAADKLIREARNADKMYMKLIGITED